jgi:hypothetical protein
VEYNTKMLQVHDLTSWGSGAVGAGGACGPRGWYEAYWNELAIVVIRKVIDEMGGLYWIEFVIAEIRNNTCAVFVLLLFSIRRGLSISLSLSLSQACLFVKETDNS